MSDIGSLFGAAGPGQQRPPRPAPQAQPAGERDNQPGPPGPPEAPALPAITLPKGGGAVHGIDEKLTVGLATGAANLSVQFPATPARQGFGPKLSLSYDSGFGNGIFGLGWRLTTASITRKTSLGLPLYQDADDSDVFILSDAEDLVPLLVPDGEGWAPVVSQDPTGAYTVRQYRPRAEAAFTRIERWQDNTTGDVHWRTTSRDNVVSLFGQAEQPRG